MKEETYKKANEIIEERNQLVEKAMKIGEILENIDKSNDESIVEFVKALLEIDEDHAVIWNIIEQVASLLRNVVPNLTKNLQTSALKHQNLSTSTSKSVVSPN